MTKRVEALLREIMENGLVFDVRTDTNDNGGGIFELLEQGDPRFSDVSSRIFGTPHDVDVGALCRAYHVDSRQIEIGELAGALDEPQDGMRVLEVKADRSSLRALHAAIKASL